MLTQSRRSEGKAIAESRSQIFSRRYLPRLRVFAEVRPLLERLRRDGVRLVVATSADESDMAKLLHRIGIEDLLSDEASSADAERSKPDGDIVEAALKKSGCLATHAVLLGDTPYDVAAAAKAGVATVALRCGGWSDADLQGAAAIYDDCADLLAHYDDSPLAPLKSSQRAT